MKIDPKGLRESRLHVVANKIFPVDEFAYRAATSKVPGATKMTLVMLARKSQAGLDQAIEHLKQWTPSV